MIAALLWLGVGVAFVALCWHLGGVELQRRELRARYSTAHLYPHAHPCADCRCGYSDQRALVWHREAAHPNTFDFGDAPNAVQRRSDADRDSAGGDPGRGGCGFRGPQSWPLETKARRHLFRGGRS